MTNLSIDYNKIKQSCANKKLLSKLIVGTAIILNLSPLLLKDKVNNHAKILLASNAFIFTLCCLKLPCTDYEDKMLKTVRDTRLKQHKTVVTGEILTLLTELEIKNQQNLADTIENLPSYQVPYFAAKYGLSPLIPPNHFADNTDNSDNSDNRKNEETPVLNVSKSIFTHTIERAENSTNCNLEWLKKAISSSCFVAGKKRSGKTFLLKWLLRAFVENCNDDDVFYISDPHYDDSDFDDPWISEEIDKKLIENQRLVKSENATLQLIRDVINAGETRKKQGFTVKKGVGKIRLFMDEIDSYSSDVQAEISVGIKKIEYEYGKYGITSVLGCHSLKKGEMGLDSSVTGSMLHILFPSVVLDRNTVLSGSFPALPIIKKMLDRYKNESLPTDGRLVVIGDDTDVYVSHVPNLNLVRINLKNEENQNNAENQNNENPVLKIKKWCDLCFATYKIYPTKELIRKTWMDLTGSDLSEKGLNLLIEKLGIEK
jgi:hypothetical protein